MPAKKNDASSDEEGDEPSQTTSGLDWKGWVTKKVRCRFSAPPLPKLLLACRFSAAAGEFEPIVAHFWHEHALPLEFLAFFLPLCRLSSPWLSSLGNGDG